MLAKGKRAKGSLILKSLPAGKQSRVTALIPGRKKAPTFVSAFAAVFGL
jgi:hypothetical protein